MAQPFLKIWGIYFRGRWACWACLTTPYKNHMIILSLHGYLITSKKWTLQLQSNCPRAYSKSIEKLIFHRRGLDRTPKATMVHHLKQKKKHAVMDQSFFFKKKHIADLFQSFFEHARLNPTKTRCTAVSSNFFGVAVFRRT